MPSRVGAAGVEYDVTGHNGDLDNYAAIGCRPVSNNESDV